MRGTIAIEEAVIPPFQHHTLAQWQPILAPGSDVEAGVKAHGARLSDIHDKRLQTMDAEGVEYMILSLTSPGAQGENEKNVAEKVAKEANDWLAVEGEKSAVPSTPRTDTALRPSEEEPQALRSPSSRIHA